MTRAGPVYTLVKILYNLDFLIFQTENSGRDPILKVLHNPKLGGDPPVEDHFGGVITHFRWAAACIRPGRRTDKCPPRLRKLPRRTRPAAPCTRRRLEEKRTADVRPSGC